MVLVILFLVIGLSVGMPDDRVIPASEVEAKIKAGEPIEFDNCTIVGDLNLSGLKIERPVHFNRTIFQDPVNFEYSIFNSTAYFRESVFNADADFSGSDFNGNADFSYLVYKWGIDPQGSVFNADADFSGSDFNADADFTYSDFNGNADFRGLNVEGDTGFEYSVFNSDAHFCGSVFNGGAHFSNSIFNDDADFEDSYFSKSASFRNSYFSGLATVCNSVFNSTAYFRESVFNSDAYFRSTFNDYVDFSESDFNDKAYFDHSIFNDDVDFEKDTFEKEVEFSEALFKKFTSFNNSQFKGSTLFKDAIFENELSLTDTTYNKFIIRWYMIKRFVYDDAAYMSLMKNFKDLGYFEDYESCYFQYRKEHRGQPWPAVNDREEWARKLIDYPLQWFYGYGTKPFNAFLWSLSIVIAFAFYWWAVGLGGSKDKTKDGLKEGEEWLDGDATDILGFSVTVFLSGTKFFIDPPALPKIEGRSRSWIKKAFIFERVLGALFSVMFFIAISGTIVRAT